MVNAEPVTRLRAGASTGSDRYGEPAPGADVETTLPAAMFAPAGSVETVTLGRVEVLDNDTLYFRAAVDLVSTDRVRVRGVVRDIEGDPGVWLGRGTVVALKSTEG